MWVLSTSRAELHHFVYSAAIPGGYAILSHTWTPVKRGGEQTFQDIQKITQEWCDQNPRDHVGEKIRRCCELAESMGYKWVWIDSCCINKESSTELSEAINSMFNWYAFAEVCYVHLEDVDKQDLDPQQSNKGLGFQNARWHKRGWTLQELLAPAFVIFLSRSWEQIGTKHSLCDLLMESTGIDRGYLIREQDFRVDASIAKRMSWAANRKTTRIEDEAYCLLGLFDVNMPTLYGEGRQAFQRLQAELVKQGVDTTLFAWGYPCHIASEHQRIPVPLSDIHKRSHDPESHVVFLFAQSPHDFRESKAVVFSPTSETPTVAPQIAGSNLSERDIGNTFSGGQSRRKCPSLELTPYGMKCRIQVAKVEEMTIAILMCTDASEKGHDSLGLFLHPAPKNPILPDQEESCEVYYISWAFYKKDTTSGHYGSKRLVSLGDVNNMCYRGNPITTTWRNIYIIAQPSAVTVGRTDGAHLLQRFLPDKAPTHYRIPRTLIQTLGALEFFPLTKVLESPGPHLEAVILIIWQNTMSQEAMRIILGTCKKPVSFTSTRSPEVHFAWAEAIDPKMWNVGFGHYEHNCDRDHIDNWTNCEHEFGVPSTVRRIRLKFTPCPYSPALVLGLGLAGSAYDDMQDNTDVPLHALLQRQAPTPSPSNWYL